MYITMGCKSKSDDREQYPGPGQQEMGRTVQAPHRRGGKALWSAGRKWPAVSPRYGERVCPGLRDKFRWNHGSFDSP